MSKYYGACCPRRFELDLRSHPTCNFLLCNGMYHNVGNHSNMMRPWISLRPAAMVDHFTNVAPATTARSKYRQKRQPPQSMKMSRLMVICSLQLGHASSPSLVGGHHIAQLSLRPRGAHVRLQAVGGEFVSVGTAPRYSRRSIVDVGTPVILYIHVPIGGPLLLPDHVRQAHRELV